MHLPLTKIRSFSTFQLHLKVLEIKAWKHSLILILSAIESFTSSISLSMMANWAYYAFCFRKDSFSLKNSWYLCQEHLTDFDRLFLIENDCGKRLWLFIWSMINLRQVTDISCMLKLRTLLFTLNPFSTAAWSCLHKPENRWNNFAVAHICFLDI